MPTTFVYAADGLRRSSSSVGGLTYNVWDERNQLRTVNSSNVTQQRFTDFPGYWGGLTSLQDLVAMVTAYYGFDMSGNTRVLTAPNGTISDQYWYTAFGVELNSSGTTNNTHHFSGEVGGIRQSALLTYLRERIVEMIIARWLSRDPRNHLGITNLFDFVMNDPLGLIDPDGMEPVALPQAPTGTLPIPRPIQKPIPIPVPIPKPTPVPKPIPVPKPPIWLPVSPVAACTCLVIAGVLVLCTPAGGPNDDDCEQQWKEAQEICAKYWSGPNPRPGRHYGIDLRECPKGFVSEVCGGNPIDYGPPKRGGR